MVLQTSCGAISGVSAKADHVTAYKGIRYATAERWKYPELVTGWDGIYEANTYGPCAVQQSTFVPEEKNGRSAFYYHEFREGLNYTYSEDCLYLNIWTPDDAKDAPVIVYIHGGAYMSGSGWDKAFEEPVWPEKGVIAVTINYRLGLLGYCCLPELAQESGHTGNYGLYDQLAALQWVHDNIASFGGNPDCITVMGQSAGANSIQHLIGGCRTSELVARAFMSSGGGDEPVLFGKIESEESRYPFWMEWKSYTGCNNLKELRALPVSKLYDAFQMMFSKGFQEVMSNMGAVADQAEFRQTGNIPAIPYMAGGNREDMKENLHLAALHWTRKQAVPSYAYYFCRQLPGDSAGAWHSADLWYWFGTLNRCWRPFTKEDQNLSEMMVRYLMNFAETGNPNDASLPEWKSSAQDADQIMVLDAGTVGMKKAENTESKGIFGW